MGLFFMTVGMEISVGLFFARYKTVISAIALLIVGKARILPPLSISHVNQSKLHACAVCPEISVGLFLRATRPSSPLSCHRLQGLLLSCAAVHCLCARENALFCFVVHQADNKPSSQTPRVPFLIPCGDAAPASSCRAASM